MRNSFLMAVGCVMFSVMLSSTSHAQIVPYKLKGSGVADPSNGTFYGPSIASHLGKMTYFAQVTRLEQVLPGILYYEAIDTQTAADGSEICLAGSGFAYLTPRPDLGDNMVAAFWDGAWNVVGGSGRFANVGPDTTPIQLSLTQEPFDATDEVSLRPFTYTKKGNIDLGRRR